MMLRTTLPIVARSRAGVYAQPIHTTPVALKTVTEKVTEVADKVNKKVGKGLASAIDAGEKAAEKTKETLGAAEETTERAKKKEYEMGQDVKGKARQAASEVRSKSQ